MNRPTATTGDWSPYVRHAHYGDPIRLGTCIGYSMEPGDRMGRLVAIRHVDDSIKKYIIRMYVLGDTWFPTGEYRTTSSIFLQPHDINRSGEGRREDQGGER